MKTILKRKPGFFLVSNAGYATDLGPEWPDLAELTLKKPRAAIVYARDQAIVLEGGKFEDALADCESAIVAKRFKAGMVGRAIGRFGDSILYERTADLCADGCEDVSVLPVVAKYVGDKELKTVHMRLVKVPGTRRIEGMASTPDVDRDNDSISPMAFAETMPSFMAKNPMMLFNHHADMFIGKIVDFRMTREGLWVAGEILKGTQCADDCWTGIQQDVLRTLSVQFTILDREIIQPKAPRSPDMPGMGDPNAPMDDLPPGMSDMPVRLITKAELYEISVVTIPCNREAVFSVAKSLKNGTDVVCSVCRAGETSCECAESRSVVDYRKTKTAGDGKVERGRDAIVKALGRDADRMARLVDREGVAQFKHHGVQDGELVLDVTALRCAMASLVAYTDQGAEPLTEAERKAAYHHLARHYADAGLVPPELGKGPRPEGAGHTLAGVAAVLTFSKEEGFEKRESVETWVKDHGFTGSVRDDGSNWVVGMRGRDEDRNGSYALDKGVLAVVYREHAPKKGAEPMSETNKEPQQAATANPPAAP
ncbi:MAG TPA: HK97 family phage prohead protease, partial [Gaiellaceae bacterium]|nr:HK97 family phage prohead protease [Gaiellaceae bacterium]